YMMGCHGKDYLLPGEPTAQELRKREKHTEIRFIGPQLPHVDFPPAPPDYLESGLLLHPKFTLEDKMRCDLEFWSKGFTRITFEWKKPNWTKSDWNSCTANILCDNWGIWVLNKRKLASVSTSEAKEQLRLWIVNKNIECTYIQNQMEHGQDIQVELLPSNQDGIKYHQKMADYCFRTALLIFPDYPHLTRLFQDPNPVSDYKESDDITIPPMWIIPSWRTTLQLAENDSKLAIKKWLLKGEKRNMTHEEEQYAPVPSGLKINAYHPSFLDQTSILQHHSMKIAKKHPDFDLADALEHLKKITGMTSTSGPALYM
ncbi:hypothetical protein VP01_4193g2, partial [Puccinia sorghi]